MREAAPRSPLRREKLLIALFEEIGPRLLIGPRWHPDRPTVKALEAVDEHRAVLLLENVAPHLDDAVGSDPEEVLVESGVVQLAQG